MQHAPSRFARLGWWLAFLAAIFLACKVPALALKAADDGTLLSTVCSTTGLKAVDAAAGSTSDRSAPGLSHGDCWCSAHFATVASVPQQPASVRPTEDTPRQAKSPAVYATPPYLRPASTAPPLILV